MPPSKISSSDKEVVLAILPIPFSVNPTQHPAEISWRLAPATTVGMALNSGTQRLKEAQVEGAWLDAQVILAATLEVDRSWLFAHGDVELTARQAELFTELIARRICHEPVAYLVGHKEFYGIDLQVDKRVLVPRPETEMLVDEVLAEIESRAGGEEDSPEVVVADIGTGSGAIALAIAANSENARIFAVDISRRALAVARENVKQIDARGQVTLLRGDLLRALPEPVDIIVANLPYISSAEYKGLDPTVRHYEPKLALESGERGLDAIARLLRQVQGKLRPRGMIYLEIGWQQGEEVAQLARDLLPTVRDIAIHRDYQGHQRMVAIAT